MQNTFLITDDCLTPNYGPLDIEIVKGLGVEVVTRQRDGTHKTCVDLSGGLGVNSLGHCNQAVVKAIQEQAAKVMHVSNLYSTSPMAELALRLSGWAHQKRTVFFCNSGAEANEAAGKLARMWAYKVHGPQKQKIIALKNGFHGRTLLAISMTGQQKMQKTFTPGETFVDFVEMNNIEDLRRVVDHDVCAIIYETIQGEGGVNLMDDEFHKEIRDLSEEYQFLRIIDEVQTGVGRTGQFFSFESMPRTRIAPDIITLAKALGGGLPLGAMIATDGIGDYLELGSHASTFGGNPVVCAAALAVINEIQDNDLLRDVRVLGDYFDQKLNQVASANIDKIKEVRGRGLMIGVELYDGFLAADVVKKMYELGFLISTAGPQVVRFLPPFIITKKDIDKTIGKFSGVINSLSKKRQV